MAIAAEPPVFAPLLSSGKGRAGRFFVPSILIHLFVALALFFVSLIPETLEFKDSLLTVLQPPPNTYRLEPPKMVYSHSGGGPGKEKKPGGGGGGGGKEGVMKVPTSPDPKFPNPKPAFVPNRIEDLKDTVDESKAITAIMNPKLAALLPKQYSTMDNLGLIKGPTNLGGQGGGVGGGIGTGVGSGRGSGIGTGEGGGWGTGKGGGWGSGIGPGGGDEIYSAGAGIVAPEAYYKPEPRFTDEAIRRRISGVVLLLGVIRKDGRVDSLRVARGLGYGLDEEAMTTVATKWKFRPAMKNGRAVDCYVTVEVDFNLY